MAHLYKNREGKEVRVHSHSSGTTFNTCQRKYFLSKPQGWKQKVRKASLEFGKCIESAIQFHMENGNSGGPEKFLELWAKIAEIPDLKFTDKEGDWQNLNSAGHDMLRLFAVRLPSLHFGNPKFQVSYRKEIYPGSVYAGIEFIAYVDLITEYEGVRSLTDIKTSGAPIPEQPELIALDPQLRDYVWITGIQRAGFLNFVKSKAGAYKHGDTVHFLDEFGDYKPGESATVLQYDKDAGLVYVARYNDYIRYEEEISHIKGKGAVALKEAATTRYGVAVTPNSITKQRMQFVQTTIPEAEVQAAGQMIGQQIAEISLANERNFWPQTGAGVRFPKNTCLYCEFLPICTGDKVARDNNLTQINRDWLDEIEDTDE